MLILDLIQVTGESEDEAVIVALQERLARLTKPVSKAERMQHVLTLLETSCRSVRKVPSQPLTRKEEDAIRCAADRVAILDVTFETVTA